MLFRSVNLKNARTKTKISTCNAVYMSLKIYNVQFYVQIILVLYLICYEVTVNTR